MHQAEIIDLHGETDAIDEARSSDIWEDWRQIPKELLIQKGFLLPHMEPEACLFYLPAYMRIALDEFPEDKSNFYLSCIWHLQRDPQIVIKEYGLTRDQVKVIAAFWEFKFDCDPNNPFVHSLDGVKNYERRLLDWLTAATCRAVVSR